ncbi:hypothetical protein DPMN_062994 [Dreissena polymorpha]|uniref:Uncharacterized protein n=1 Tax=Dreissena polymorpha TaxID=45954 RepID=A0A9D4C9N7_DREPO|nr:hypothetical protein DPMN_062994 [Dreissena polymorpha]
MECRPLVQLECEATLLHTQIGLLDAKLVMHRLAYKRVRRLRQRKWWIRTMLGPERRLVQSTAICDSAGGHPTTLFLFSYQK